eukprot:CAMPEP_0204862060 /NCGR_PEP_ID=MMETSP1348-20121228/2171_1 /ASSEMBLY_ACC=CAM_ASM_000700 /TAXON_ID=215587 /ORGANISM="Aplanochytrium stocchinoi, Strain GSBS06" /LENGTH=399 /DNA_ID=CAMNT_0052011803 /DNA_START=339 /DNA_END=1538 /DNA_ORIENTATION=+
MNMQPHMYYQHTQEQAKFVQPNHNYNQGGYMNQKQNQVFQDPNVNYQQQHFYGNSNLNQPQNFGDTYNQYSQQQYIPNAVPNPNYVQPRQQHTLPRQVTQTQQHNSRQYPDASIDQSAQNQSTISSSSAKTGEAEMDSGKTKALGVPKGKKGRSLAELMDKQIAEGKIDPNEEIVDRNNRYVNRPDKTGPWDQEGCVNSNSNRGGRRQGNSNHMSNSSSLEYDGDASSLNWQQQQLLSSGGGHGGSGGGGKRNSRNRDYGDNNDRNSIAPPAFNSARRRGDGGESRSYNNGDYQQRRAGYNNNNNRNNRQPNTYQQRNNTYSNNYQNRGRSNYNRNGFGAPATSKHYDSNPEWADDVGTSQSKQVNDTSLNWQQQSLVNRDESDPFNRFVRGENELIRE